MVKGVSIKFASYETTVPQFLSLVKFDQELKKHERIVIKPTLNKDSAKSTPLPLVEAVVKFCVEHKNPGSELFIAEGAEETNTEHLFEEHGYRALAEKYNVGLVDLNTTDCEPVGKNEFVGFEQIMYPSIIKDSFVVTLPKTHYEEGEHFHGALANMRGAFPALHYRGFLSRRKNKLDSYPFKYQVHDINLTKLPNFALIDMSEKGFLLGGHPLEMDKQAAKLLGLDWRSIGYMRMLDETLTSLAKEEIKVESENR